MKITWLDIKKSVNKLMFLGAAEINTDTIFPNEYKDAVVESANFALMELGKMFPLKELYSITQTESDEEGYNEYDMLTLTLSGAEQTFLGFDDVSPVLIQDDVNGWIDAPDYQILLDRYLYIKKAYDGSYKVIYKKYFTRITEDTADNTAIQLPPEVANIMPLLMVYRIFKDDDAYKAAQYFNEYMNARAELKTKPTKKMIDVYEGDYYELSNAVTF